MQSFRAPVGRVVSRRAFSRCQAQSSPGLSRNASKISPACCCRVQNYSRARCFEAPLPCRNTAAAVAVQARPRLGRCYGTAVEPEPRVHNIFETATQTWQYIVADPKTREAVIIDPVLDYDPASQAVTTKSADGLLDIAREHGYKISRILETHAHADHLTAASYIQSRLVKDEGSRPLICIGKRITQVQDLFSRRYGVPKEEYDAVFDHLFEDDEAFEIGEVKGMAIHLPGHTPDHLGYKIGDNIFCGDSIFHHDIGTARCDFPGGSASSLWSSGRKVLAMPENVKVWAAHDYPPSDRPDPAEYATVGEHRKLNKHLREGITEDEFVRMRMERDDILGQPRLLHQSLQMNIRGGKLPRPTDGRHRLLHLPLRLNGLEW